MYSDLANDELTWQPTFKGKGTIILGAPFQFPVFVCPNLKSNAQRLEWS